MDRIDRYLKAVWEKNGLIGVVVLVLLLAGLAVLGWYLGWDLGALLRVVGLG